MEIAGSTPSTNDPDKSKKSPKTSKEPMKVKYIADPVMVNAKDASEFKVIVQELTGKDSDAGNRRRRSPGSGRSGTALVAAGEHGQLPQLGYGMNQSESIAYEELDNFFCQVSENLSKFQFP